MDFLNISTRNVKENGKQVIKVYPSFIINARSNDLMIRGGDFYAIWDPKNSEWSTSEQTAVDLIDNEITKKVEELRKTAPDLEIQAAYLSNSDTTSIDKWHKYVQKQSRDNFHPLNQKVIFANSKVGKRDYASWKLSYNLEECDISSYEEIMSVLYAPAEREKLEWAIGAIISGDSKIIQKFIVLYGGPGTGKSTFLNILQLLFEDYVSIFDAKSLASSNDQFSLESFQGDPLVSIQHDGDLSRIEDNTKLNSIVSHEEMRVNVKFRSHYTARFSTFLFMGTNKPVKITEAKSGIIRRLIDVNPTGEKIEYRRFKKLMSDIPNELGGIALHCLNVYNERGESYYDSYVPLEMLGATNDFYDFMLERYDRFIAQDSTDLNEAWNWYSTYCDEFGVTKKLQRRIVGLELRNYFSDFKVDTTVNGKHRRNYYSGFLKEKFEYGANKNVLVPIPKTVENPFIYDESTVFDKLYSECPAQYSNEEGVRMKKWVNVTTKLKDLDTRKIHYVKVPLNLIVIDFDKKNDKGEKDLELNLKEIEKWPKTYGELSKSGGGIHLCYIYEDDPTLLSRVYDDDIEIKVFNGDATLRRKLTKCNNYPIAKLKKGSLPLKGDKKVINFEGYKDAVRMRAEIIKCLNKEHHGYTKPEVCFIYKILEDAYNSEKFSYDVSDLKGSIFRFASKSSNNSAFCTDLAHKMHFVSKVPPEEDSRDIHERANPDDYVFYDVEVFPNFFGICYKKRNGMKVILKNPSAYEVREVMKYPLVGFNCRRYDNHILFAAGSGYSNEQLYNLSQNIINNGQGFFGKAYNVSELDLYDVCSVKQSLKKWEIAMKIRHDELGWPWDKPVPEEMWDRVMEYCGHDVDATEELFNHRHADYVTRCILSDLSGLPLNATNRMHITKILLEGDEHAKDQFEYRDLSEEFPGYEFVLGEDNKYHNMYRGVDLGFGGYVEAEVGMWGNVGLFDVGNMHGATIDRLNKFGKYTQNFRDLRNARMAIKHKEFDKARKMLGGKLAKYLTNEEEAGDLEQAIKLILNSTYGIAAASFDNPLRDPRDKNNIIALRGALFMKTLRDEVVKRGYKVVHIKTDSIKIPDVTRDIEQFVIEFGKKYGYEFEHEATYNKMCLVNDAVYIAKYDSMGIRNKGNKHANEWTATGAQFQHPYVFKKLFSKEPITFDDKCETREVNSALYLDKNENLPEGEHDYQFVGKIGQFCPVVDGVGGGILLRATNEPGKYAAASASKGYRWLEASEIEARGLQDKIDERYFAALVDAAVENISQYGDFEWFASDAEYLSIVSDELPF